MTFATKILLIMGNQGINRKDLAKKCCITERTITNAIRSKHMPSRKTIKDISKGLEVPLAELLEDVKWY